MSEKRDNSGTLGKNERKEKDSHPSHTGQCLIDGTEYWISAWVKEGRTGKFFSLAFKPKEARTPAPPPQERMSQWRERDPNITTGRPAPMKPRPPIDPDDEIPF